MERMIVARIPIPTSMDGHCIQNRTFRGRTIDGASCSNLAKSSIPSCVDH
uniref:Uncharacterized protein n=1 Tax=Heterorhabditis bacteriophora TaxID=37862 RepID=A0A1I7WW43_HETBA